MQRALRTTILAGLAMLATTAVGWASGVSYGATAATAAIDAGAAFTVTDMLRWAVEDEYLARGEYAAIIKNYGQLRPYTNIMESETQHLSWLRTEFLNRGLAFPADASAEHVIVPINLKAAAQAGVDAEIANIAMYKAFLGRPELSLPENSSVKALFDQLMRASENHLRAFRTQLAKY